MYHKANDFPLLLAIMAGMADRTKRIRIANIFYSLVVGGGLVGYNSDEKQYHTSAIKYSFLVNVAENFVTVTDSRR
jgi:hypothetical protein